MECCRCHTKEESQESTGVYGGGTDLGGSRQTREGRRRCSRYINQNIM